MKKVFTGFCAVLLLAAIGAGLADAYNAEISITEQIGSFAKSHGIGAEGSVSGELPDIDLNDWSILLVNSDNPVPERFDITTALTAEGYLFDERAVSALDEMLAAGRNQGLQLILTSAYRTYTYQDMLFQDKVYSLMNEMGLDRAAAEDEAAKVVARPGTSEHNIGLAADIVCEYYNILDEGYEGTAEAQWLRENCADYGFILRYDKGKEDITKIIYEPWHFRYVGRAAARYIMENDLCLEEFLALYD